MHMFTFLLDDVGIPTNFRHMNGSGVHAFRWISASGTITPKNWCINSLLFVCFLGVERFVKFTWVSNQGVESLETEEKVKNITNAAHATLDLHTSILNGDFPSWTLVVQLLDPNRVDEVCILLIIIIFPFIWLLTRVSLISIP